MYNMTNNEDKLNFENILEDLEKNGSSFVIATVIRTMSSTAAKPGMKAIISNKGKIVIELQVENFFNVSFILGFP